MGSLFSREASPEATTNRARISRDFMVIRKLICTIQVECHEATGDGDPVNKESYIGKQISRVQ